VINAGPLMGADDLAQLLRMTGPRATIALDLQAPIMAQLDPQNTPRVWVTLKDYQTVWLRMGYQLKLWKACGRNAGNCIEFKLDDLLAQAPSRPPTVAPDPGDIALLQPTGGTTGTLKVAELSHRNLIVNATQMACWARLRHGQERVLGVLPMFHVYGLSTGLIMPLYCGATMLPLTRFHVADLLHCIETYRPTVLPLVPMILERICESLEIGPRRNVLEALKNRFILSGAAPLSPELQHRFEALTSVSVIQGYGLTEASPITHANPPGSGRSGSIGLPFPDTRIRLADLDDPALDAEPGEPGELCLSGPQIMRGYFQNDAETARTIHLDADGTRWLHTGDIAGVDEDGFYRILDRKKEMIIRSGMKVYPARVEGVLLQHPRVVDAAVIGRPDPVHTEVVVAVVSISSLTPTDDRKHLAHELRTFCRQHLAPYEVPVEFEFLSKLPRNPLGKLQKFRLARDDGQEVA
jgi:long-chain acyl-CoA synthetase